MVVHLASPRGLITSQGLPWIAAGRRSEASRQLGARFLGELARRPGVAEVEPEALDVTRSGIKAPRSVP